MALLGDGETTSGRTYEYTSYDTRILGKHKSANVNSEFVSRSGETRHSIVAL
jgi:hypothetical protein